jgi:hypothetical protein
VKKIVFSLITIIILFALSACSEKDNPTEAKIYGYILEQFVTQEAVLQITDPTADSGTDFRALYAYEIVADDGWSPRQSSNAGYDLNWGTLRTGYIVPDDSRRTWFDNDYLPGAFRVKNSEALRLYRKVDVEVTAGPLYSFELGALPMHCVPNWNGENEDAIKLSDLLAAFEGYSQITLTAYDDYSMDYTTEQIQDGYYLLNSEVTTFPGFNDEMNGGQKRFKKLAKITVDGNAGEVDFSTAAPETADLQISLPISFSGYEATELTGY